MQKNRKGNISQVKNLLGSALVLRVRVITDRISVISAASYSSPSYSAQLFCEVIQMGADLYIEKMDREKQIIGFAKDINVGYFRDAYNETNLLWKFGLSYWQFEQTTGILLIKENGKANRLTPEGAKKLLDILKNKEEKFNEFIKGINKIWLKNKNCTGTPKDWKEYFKKEYANFRAFLIKAIELNSDIILSV